VRTILFPQLPLVWSKLPLSLPESISSFLSAGNVKLETLTLELAGLLTFKVVAIVFGMLVVLLALIGFGADGGDIERASLGLIDRIDVDEGFR
jgi:hypothetical protein